MDGWAEFLFMTGGLLFFALLVWLGGKSDERKWKRAMEADDAARKAAE